MKRLRGKWRTLLIIVLDLLLIAALVKVFAMEKDRERRSLRTLNRAVSKVAEELPDSAYYDEPVESAVEEAEPVSAAEEVESVAESPDSAEEPAIPVPAVISVRGDSFSIPGGDPQTAYPAMLEQQLADAGINMRVLDYTLDERSALTHLYYAGIDEEVIGEYIDSNAESDYSKRNSKFETEIGDVSGLSLTRNDYDAVPVIFMGYYGGWGGDLFELIEMQKRILATYSQQEYYIIVGNHPLNVTDVDTFDKLMSGYWGKDHYLGVVGVNGSQLTTREGHQELARRIMVKLKKQGYLPK